MTNTEALREAKKRWGKTARVRRLKGKCVLEQRKSGNWFCRWHGPECPGRKPIYEVGSIFTVPGLGSGLVIKGRGTNWQEALDKAPRY